MVWLSATFKELNVQYMMGYARPEWRLVLDLLYFGRAEHRGR